MAVDLGLQGPALAFPIFPDALLYYKLIHTQQILFATEMKEGRWLQKSPDVPGPTERSFSS